MSGKYLKEVHGCNKPEFQDGHNEGTIWQCDCGAIYSQSWRNGIYGIPGGWAWRRIDPQLWDAENLVEKPYIIYLPEGATKNKWRLFK